MICDRAKWQIIIIIIIHSFIKIFLLHDLSVSPFHRRNTRL